MAVSKFYECSECETSGKITIKVGDVGYEDIVYCPICGADIYEEEDANYDE